MSTEDKTKHNGIEEPKKQNKSSHGNEVKYFTHRNAAISVFSVFKLRKKHFSFEQPSGKNLDNSLSTQNSYLNEVSEVQKAVFRNRNRVNPKVIEYSNIETVEACSRQASTEVAILIALLRW